MSENEKKPTIVMSTGAGGIRALTGMHEAPEPKDPVLRQPDITGTVGRAWRIDLPASRRRLNAPDDDAAIGGWIIEARWAHPIWHSYLIFLIHLREHPTLGMPKINMAGATHEFWLWASDPDHPRGPAIIGEADPRKLLPMNFGSQIRSTSDESAIRLMELAIKDVCDGRLSRDTDYFGLWIERFGDSLVREEFKRK